MCTITVNILLALTMQTLGEELVGRRAGDEEDSGLIEHSMDKLANKFVNRMFDRRLSLLHLHRADLDSTMLGKRKAVILSVSALTVTWKILGKRKAVVYKPPTIASRTILITGASTGLGLESAKRLAQAGAKVIMTARTQAKADAAVAEVKAVAPKAEVVALVLDLADLRSIRSFPAKYKAKLGKTPIDVLMENAGVMAIPERLTTADGFEKTVGTNHLGHFALVSAMMPILRKAAHGFRIIIVSSEAHKFASESSMRAALAANLDLKDYSQWGSYGISKAANVLFANELQRRFDTAGIPASAISLHPGMVQTDLGRYLVQGVDDAEKGVPLKESFEALGWMKKALLQALAKFTVTVEQGANTQVYLAAAADSDGDLTKDGGKYFVNMQVAKPKAFTNNRELATKLWEVSEMLTGTKIPLEKSAHTVDCMR